MNLSVSLRSRSRKRPARARLLDDDAARDWGFWVRINALDTGLALGDLSAIVRPGLDGIVLPKSNDASDLRRIGDYIDVLEAKAGMTA